jgi:hypothetical protein
MQRKLPPPDMAEPTSYNLVESKGRDFHDERKHKAALASLSVGRAEVFLPRELDSALIKLHISQKDGVAKTLCWPPNCLRPAKTVSSARVFPEKPKS